METHEELVNVFIKEYFQGKANTTGLNKKQGDLLISALKNISNGDKVDAGIK